MLGYLVGIDVRSVVSSPKKKSHSKQQRGEGRVPPVVNTSRPWENSIRLGRNMETTMAVDVGVLDPDLLLLPDIPLPASKPLLCKLRLDDLFAQWLSLPDTQRLVSEHV